MSKMIEYSPDSHTMRQLENLSAQKMCSVNDVLDDIVKTFLNGNDFSSGSERRLFPRMNVSIPAVVEYSKHKRECKIHPVQIIDVSLGGAKISASSEFNLDSVGKNSSMMLVFSPYDSGKTLSFQCIPCRFEAEDSSTEIGLKFVDGSFDDYKMLAERMH